MSETIQRTWEEEVSVVEEIFTLFEKKGDAAYYGELVSQSEHGLQAAYLAEQEGAPDTLVVSALLHDIGHLLGDQPEDIAEQGIDTRHEDSGAAWLARYFGPEISEPMRLHVEAKRYLCAVEPDYLEGLSDASKLSLQLQGGPFAPEEVAAFESNPYFREAVRLRHWDDLAKIQNLPTPGFAHYRARLEACLKQ